MLAYNTSMAINSLISPPETEAELLQRARQVAGLTLSQLANQLEEQVPEKLGPTISPLQELLSQSTEPIHKVSFSCYGSQPFVAQLAALNRKQVLVTGIETHICVYQTILGGLQKGFRMWVATDAVSSRAETNYITGLDRIREIGGVVGNTELIIYELLHRAGTPEFKELLPFLK